MIAPVQLDYLHAKAVFEVTCTDLYAQENALEAARHTGEIDAAEYESHFAALDHGRWNAALDALHAARELLLTWGQAQTRQQWTAHQKDFPGVTLEELDALFANRRIWVTERLVKIVLQLDT